MEAIMSAALSGTLKMVGNKLGALLMKEYSSIVGVKKDLEELKDLAKEINNWLEAAGHNATWNDQSFNWLNKLKDVAYDVDDVVDGFQLKAEKQDLGDGGIMSKYLCTKPESFISQCKAANKIKTIKKRFAAIVKQRTDMTAIVGTSDPRLNKTIVDMQTLPIISEAGVLGRDQDKKKIITKLVRTNGKQEIDIVSIIGLGGTGKTTLARLVFNDGEIIKKHFEVILWVHVSQEFNVEKLIQKLFEAVTKEKSNPYPPQYISEKIQTELTEKKFLLVLDDVWIENQSQYKQFQEDIMVYLVKGASGSRILLTTRSRRVAEAMGSTELYDLPLLSLDDSWQLFRRSFGEGLKELDYEYQQIGKEIVGKCGGVPLAIKVIAGTLRDKKLIGEWTAMRDSNLLDVEGDESVSACLKLSYFYLPCHLKQCFTMCSLFPKGTLIYKQQLIDQWIAHDMISLTPGVDDLEHIGDGYLSSLVQVYFLEDPDEDLKIMRCRMHDLVHDLARSILSQEISTIVPEDATAFKKGYRYFSLNEQPRNLFPKKVFDNARAIYVDKVDDVTFGKAMKNANHLRSIIVNSISSTAVLTAMFQVKYLKYLDMSGLQCEALPEAISDIWTLQALYLTSSDILELPSSIGKLKKLRTLKLSRCSKLKSLPDSIGDCHMLSSLGLEGCPLFEEMPNSIGRNKKLRVLRLVSTGICKLPSSITTLENVEYLEVKECHELVNLPEGIGNLKKLRTLNLSGCSKLGSLPDSIGDCHMLSTLEVKKCDELVNLPEDIGNLKKLRTLNLSCCAMLNSLPDSIGDCHMLSNLGLEGRSFEKLPDSIGRNRRLKELILVSTSFRALPSSITTLENLEYLKIENYFELVKLQGIGKLKKLKALDLDGLKGLPSGIGQLTGLEKLNTFCVEYYKEYAHISELANLSRISGKLSICFLRRLMDPHDARKACLKQKENLLELELSWGDRYGVNAEHEAIVLDDLEPPSGIEQLEISMYGGRRFARWMTLNQVGCGAQGLGPFPHLTNMSLDGFPNLKHLDGLVQLPCLEKLHLKGMPALESISGGPFPSLVELKLERLDRLGEVWMVTDKTLCGGEEGEGCGNHSPHQSGQVQIGSRLAKLDIEDCPRLGVEPYFPTSLEYIELDGCNSNLLLSPSQGQGSSSSSNAPPYYSHLKVLKIRRMESSSSSSPPTQPGLRSGCMLGLLQHMSALESLEIYECGDLTELPECLGELCSLRKMTVKYCNSLSRLPESIGKLTSLQVLEIECSALVQFPEGLGELRSLCTFKIYKLKGLTCLPESMRHLTSLKELQMGACKALVQLPQGVGELSSLRKLNIFSLRALTCLPQSLCHLMSLEELAIGGCCVLGELPERLDELRCLRKLRICSLPGLTCLPQSLCQLMSLEELEIGGCDVLGELPERLDELRCLRKLTIWGLEGQTCLPRLPTSLEDLKISRCPGIKSLPKEIKSLTSLQRLDICSCPDLERRCEKGMGEDWRLISHIPLVYFRNSQELQRNQYGPAHSRSSAAAGRSPAPALLCLRRRRSTLPFVRSSSPPPQLLLSSPVRGDRLAPPPP